MNKNLLFLALASWVIFPVLAVLSAHIVMMARTSASFCDVLPVVACILSLSTFIYTMRGYFVIR